MDSDEDSFNYVPLKRKKISSFSQISCSEIKKKNTSYKTTSTQIKKITPSKYSKLTFQTPQKLKLQNRNVSKNLSFSQRQRKDPFASSDEKKKVEKYVPEDLKGSCESVVSISSSNSEEGQVYCSICCMPWKEYLHGGRSKQMHINECKRRKIKTLEECSYGLGCSFSHEAHYWKFKHEVLYKARSKLSSINYISEVRSAMQPTSDIKELDMALNHNDNLLIGIDDDNIADLNLEDLIRKEKCSPLKNNDINLCERIGLVSTEKVKHWLASNCSQDIKAEVKPGCNSVVDDTKNCVHFHINATSASKNLVQTTLDKFFKDSSPSLKDCIRKVDEKDCLERDFKKDSVNSADVVKKWKGLFVSNEVSNASTSAEPNLSNYSKEFNGNLPVNNSNYNNIKKCPFYKKIEDTNFVVDAFNYGYIDGISSYFLSHFHYDHYIGLRKTFNKNIFCSNITANLIKLKIGVKDKFLRVLPLEESRIIEGVEVTCFDANHCPGAVMFLFSLPTGKTILHVGDFRFNHNMESINTLWSSSLDVLYLDTTYLNYAFDFPSQERILEKIAEIAVDHKNRIEKIVFVVGAYTIGKEKVFKTIANIFDCKIYADPDKTKILKCLDDKEITKRLTSIKSEAKVHVVPMLNVNVKKLEQYVNKLGPSMVGVGICPSGWKHNSNIADDLEKNLQPKQVGNIYLYEIPYSEHSSVGELERFVKFAEPQKIIPTVHSGPEWQREEMKKILNSWQKQSQRRWSKLTSQLHKL